MKIFLTILGVFYTLSPYDLLPDFFVGFGWLDDLIILGLLWKYFYAPLREQYRYAKTYQKHRQFSGNRTSGSNFQFRKETNLKDPWSVLGIGRDASIEEIKRAYRRLALKYHPDKVFSLGEEIRVLAENRFKEIQWAYQELKPG